MTPVNWDSPTWGQPGHNVHIASDCPDRHDASEAQAEAGRG